MDKDFPGGYFEELLKERTGEYKMYPTEKVWSSIYSRLHTRRKWHFIGGSTFALLILAAVFVLMEDNSHPPTRTFSTVVRPAKTVGSPAIALTTPLTASLTPEKSSRLSTYRAFMQTGNAFLSFSDEQSGQLASGDGNQVISPVVNISPRPEQTDGRSDVNNVAEGSSLRIIKNDPLLSPRLDEKTTAVVSSLKSLIPATASRYRWLFHFEPSVSFRTLKSKSAITTNNYGYILIDNNGYDINHLVEQMPSVGFEVGTDVLYAVNSRFRLKAGLQFNYSRYTAKAYTSIPHTVNIALGGPGTGGVPLQNFQGTTNFGNGAGISNASATWIPDQRVEFSVPIGAEFEILHTGAFSWNVAGTVQPSYIMNAKAFILSSDYKSYVQDPNLLRRWNMNLGAETFLRFNRGKIQLQVGPQFRYQLLPSFINSYPVKEHIYDAGFKIGVTKSF